MERSKLCHLSGPLARWLRLVLTVVFGHGAAIADHVSSEYG